MTLALAHPPVANTEEEQAICDDLALAREALRDADGDFQRAQRIRGARQALVVALERLFFALRYERKVKEAREELHRAREELATLGAETRRIS